MAQVRSVVHVLHLRMAPQHAAVVLVVLHVTVGIQVMERNVYSTVYIVHRTAQNDVQGAYLRLVLTMNGQVALSVLRQRFAVVEAVFRVVQMR